MNRAEQWWKSAVVYQIYPRSFADSDGDGIGDLKGITARLDYLAQLGVDAVWLSPIYRSPQDDNGYDISDYCDIDPVFGTLADFDELLAGLHQRGIKLIMDLVVNHSSDEHPWFQASRERRDGKDDWYIWRDPRPGFAPGEPGAEPTDWTSYFSGSTWQWDETRGQYYLHLFSRKQPDLNWENPEVRRAVQEIVKWWIDRGVDGFRMDVINHISKFYPLSDGKCETDGPRVHEFLQELNQAALAGHNLVTVGETPSVSVEQAALYTDPARQEVDMVFQFEHMELDSQPDQDKWALKALRLPELKENLAKWQYALEGRGWNSLYWNNHDQPRIVSRWGDDSPQFRVASAKTLGTVLHMLKGTPYIYQGEEFGMTNAYFTSIDQYQDLETVNHHAEQMAAGADEAALLESFRVKSRDNARTPMTWDDSANAGFTTGQPWLSVVSNYREVNAAAAVADPDSVFYHYRELIGLRHQLAVVREGVFELLQPNHEQLFSYTRTLPDGAPSGEPSKLLVLANMSSQPCELPQECRVPGQLLLGTHADPQPNALAAWESRVLDIS